MTTPITETEKDSVPFYPDHVKTEFYVVIGIVIFAIVVGILGTMYPVGLQEPANPLDTPLHVKPEWYFLFLYQILKIIPPDVLGIQGTVFGVVAVMVALIVVTLWPFLDRREESTMKNTWIRLAVAIIGLIAVIALTLWGEVG